MFLARVTGAVVAETKVTPFVGIKLLWVQPLDERLEPDGRPCIACDTVMAGVGDVVYVTTGSEASTALPDPFNPTDMSIVGIVDGVDTPE